jgi:hypothetical protein
MPPEDWDLAQPTALQKPTRVKQAQGRLDAAVGRLETALQRIRPAGDGEVDAEVARLRQEVDNLNARNSELVRVNESVSARIDVVIGNLKASLGD